MNKKTLLIGAGVIGAVAIYMYMKKQSNEKSISETPSTEPINESENGKGGKTDADIKPKPPRERERPTRDLPTSETPQVVALQYKPVASIEDLKTTPLGIALNVEIINSDAKTKINQAIANLPTEQKAILPYIVLVDYNTWSSDAYINALNQKFGTRAGSIANSVYSKLISASRFIPIATNQGALGRRRDCRQEALNSGIKRWQFRQMADYVNKCVSEGGYDSGFDGSYSFNTSAFDTDTEQFAFNGHIF